MNANIDAIYTGYWIDYSRGSSNGRLITLTALNARILVAVLAVFVKIAGSRLWGKFTVNFTPVLYYEFTNKVFTD